MSKYESTNPLLEYDVVDGIDESIKRKNCVCGIDVIMGSSIMSMLRAGWWVHKIEDHHCGFDEQMLGGLPRHQEGLQWRHHFAKTTDARH